jgi:hypothetical protein
MVFVTLITAVFNAVSPVSCHSFLNLSLCRRKSSGPCRSLFMSERVFLLVCSQYVDATEAVRLLAALSATSPELICIVEKINSEAHVLLMFQQIPNDYWFCHDPLCAWWFESSTSDMWQLDIPAYHIIENIIIPRKRIMGGICGNKIQISLFQTDPIISPLKTLIFHNGLHNIRITYQYGLKYWHISVCASLKGWSAKTATS